jgi:catechol 2,3-dioxygenase-like lactoylglutathione lyase family enzyme
MFRHVGIVVNDLERQLYFYRDLLGLDIMYHEIECDSFLERILSITDVNIEIYKLGYCGQTIVELLKYNFPQCNQVNNENRFNNFGINHFAITVSDIEKTYDKLSKNGVLFVSPPTKNKKETHMVCFCRDFESNFIEIVQPL